MLPRSLNAPHALEQFSVVGRRVEHPAKEIIFAQGDEGSTVRYLESGMVRLSVASKGGKEAVGGILKAGAFFGEICLAGLTHRVETATAVQRSTVIVVEVEEMVRALYGGPGFAFQFLSHMLARNDRFEADLVDQLVNPAKKRLARALVMLSGHGGEQSVAMLTSTSRQILAEMVGTTRSRVNHFLKQFETLGYIERRGNNIQIDSSLFSSFLHDQ